LLVGKKRPAIFVFDLKESKMEQVHGIRETLYPQYPVFDESGKGVLFQGVDMPHFKLGLIFCLNRPTSLYYIADPVFDKKKVDAENKSYIRRVNPENEYLAMQPRFTRDFSKIAYIGRTEKFLSHSGNYELKTLSWPLPEGDGPAESETVVNRMSEYPADDAEFAGLYGYNDTYSQGQFLVDSKKFFFTQSQVKGLDRLFFVDTDGKKVRMLRIPGISSEARAGSHVLLRVFEDTLVVRYSEMTKPPTVVVVRFKSTSDELSLDQLVAEDNLKVDVLDKLTLD